MFVKRRKLYLSFSVILSFCRVITFAFHSSFLRLLSVAPSCKVRKEQLYGALKYETVLLKCEVVANPQPSAFYWTFNNSGDSSSVSPSRFNYSGFISVIKYTPITDMDYGTLACWAQNSVGDQKYPCLYQVVAAGKRYIASIT